MLNIITGRAYSGKTTMLLEKINSNTENNMLSYVMVPEQLTLETEKMFIHAMEKPLFLCKIMSFDRLSSEVISKVGGAKRQYIDDIGKVMLIENILLENRDELTLYKSAINKTGFIENIVKLLTELKKYDIKKEELEKFSQNTVDVVLREKVSEISKIYGLLEEKLIDKYIDNEYRLSLLCEKISAYSRIKKFEVFFDNFVSFTTLELNVIEKLLENNIDVTVTLACDIYDESDDSFKITRNTYELLENISKKIDSDIKHIHLSKSYNENVELKHLEENFGKNEYVRYNDKTKNITLISADVPDTEVQKVADEINFLVRKEGYKYSDIAVVVSSQIGYEKIIREIFDRYDIPFFIDSKREITGENVISLVFSFLDMYSKNMNYVNVMSFFKSGLTDISKKDYEKLENHMIKWNQHGKKYINEKIFDDVKYFYDDYSIDYEKKDNEKSKEKILIIKENINISYKYVEVIYKKYKSLKNKKKVREFSDILVDFLKTMDVQSKLDEIVDRQKNIGNYEIAGEISQTYNILLETIDKINTLVEDYTVDVSFYKKMLYQGLNTQKIALIPHTLDTVMVMDIQRSKSLGYKALFMLGMNDTLLPNIQKDSVILSENDRKVMKDEGIGLKNTAQDVISQEKMAIYTIISRAREKIYFSYPMTDVGGMGSEKSIYVTTMQYIFSDMNRINIFFEDVKNFENITKKVAFDNMRAELLSMIEDMRFYDDIDDDQDIDVIKKYKYFEQDTSYNEDISIMKKSIFIKNEYKNIDKKYVGKLYDNLRKSSISQIETYNRCPFSYFMKYGIKPQKRSMVAVDALESGNIMHKYMERLSQDVLIKGKNKIEKTLGENGEGINDFVEQIYSDDEFLKENIKLLKDSSKKQDYILKRLKKISKKSTAMILEQKQSSQFDTTNAELEIIKKVGDTEFKCVIDRVDSIKIDNGSEYCQILDYKSKERSINFEKVYNGQDLQMLFYLYALTDNQDKNPYSALYFPMIDTIIGVKSDSEDIQGAIADKMKMSGVILDDENLFCLFDKNDGAKTKYAKVSSGKVKKEEMQVLLKKVVEIIGDSIDKIISGDITPMPVDKACDYCEYKNICKFDKTVSGYNDKKIKKLDGRNKKDAFFEMMKAGDEDGKN